MRSRLLAATPSRRATTYGSAALAVVGAVRVPHEVVAMLVDWDRAGEHAEIVRVVIRVHPHEASVATTDFGPTLLVPLTTLNPSAPLSVRT